MDKQFYIIRCALREVRGKCKKETERELELFVSRMQKFVEKAKQFGVKSDWEVECNEIFYEFRQTFDVNRLNRITSWNDIEQTAHNESEFDNLTPIEKINAYLRRISDLMSSQLRSNAADDIMYVPLHASYLPYGIAKSGKSTPKKSRNTKLVERIANGREPILIVRGLPGTGKSVAMRQVVYKLAVNAINSTRGLIPIFIPLGQIGNISHINSEGSKWVSDEVKNFLSGDSFDDRELRFMARFIAQNLDSLLNDGRCMIVFDGMDELPKQNYDEKCRFLLRFAQEWTTAKKNNRFIFSCREFDYPKELQIDSLVLFPFDWEDVEKYLKTHLPLQTFEHKRREAKQAWDQGGAVRGLLDNPFFLHLATRHILDYPNENLPLNRGLLFDSYVNRIFRNDDIQNAAANLQTNKVLSALQVLALWISDRKISGTTALWNDLQRDEQGRAIREAIENCQEEKSFPYFVSISSEGITFRHHRLREFFTALALRRKLFQ